MTVTTTVTRHTPAMATDNTHGSGDNGNNTPIHAYLAVMTMVIITVTITYDHDYSIIAFKLIITFRVPQ